jgi:hypothetical protein
MSAVTVQIFFAWYVGFAPRFKTVIKANIRPQARQQAERSQYVSGICRRSRRNPDRSHTPAEQFALVSVLINSGSSLQLHKRGWFVHLLHIHVL